MISKLIIIDGWLMLQGAGEEKKHQNPANDHQFQDISTGEIMS